MDYAVLVIRWGLLLATPVLAWLALPGRFAVVPLLVVCLVPLFHLLMAARTRRGVLASGLAAGVVFYALQLYWIVSVLSRYGGLPVPLAVAAMLLLALYMSCYLAVFAAGFVVLARSRSALLFLLGAPSLWVGLDWCRSWLFSGFPWMDIGYGLWAYPRLLQAADLVGHHGFSFAIVLANAVIFLFTSGAYSRAQRGAGVVALACVAGFLTMYSLIRWSAVEEAIAAAPTVTVGVVQGNVEQSRKWSPAERERIVAQYLRLSGDLTERRRLDLLVWPETALPFYPRSTELYGPITSFTDRERVPLLTGAPWLEVRASRTERLVDYFNSAVLVRPGSGYDAVYAKSHLVPWGEYVPLQRYLGFIQPLVEAAGDFTPGTVGDPVAVGPMRAGILICYESIFADISRRWVEAGANLLINLTNDAWYGKSSAPHQSWAMTVYRAVETRRSLVRSANTGISGMIDPLGRVRSESGLFAAWAEPVTVPLSAAVSWYLRGGYLFAPFCAGMAVLITAAALVRRKAGAKGSPQRPSG